MGINLDDMKGTNIPSLEWEISDVLDDIIMVQFVDCTADGEYVDRGGILVKLDVTKNVWRVGKVIKAGPDCSSKIKPGVCVMFPNDKGIQIPKVGSIQNVAFINEERIFGICEATGTAPVDPVTERMQTRKNTGGLMPKK